MSNTHEYVVFDRAELEPALSLRWGDFDKKYRGWGQWSSAEEFLVDWALDDQSQIEAVNQILAKKTVRATLLMCDDPFHFLWGLLDSKRFMKMRVDVDKCDYSSGDDLVSCAGAGFIRGVLSLAAFTAVYQLHASGINPFDSLPPKVAYKVMCQANGPPMLPCRPDLMQNIGDGLGISQTRRVLEFLDRAWRERWPLHIDGREMQIGDNIRSSVVAGRFAKQIRRRSFVKPCMFRWLEH